MKSARRVLVLVLVNLAVLALLLALLEGAASLLSVTSHILNTPGVPEDVHAEHDPELGWVNRPDVHIPDMYGPGVEVRTNAQRFRNSRDVPRAVPEGKVRIICSGDSFTFGYGVSNDDAWCQRLAALDPRVETVNMGLGGYGVDQAYLWYMRDGTELEHDVHLFAFLTDDFRRMRSDRFMGYGKPYLEVRGDSLAITNLPVPRTSRLTRWRALHGETLARLDMVRISRRLLGLEGRSTAPAEEAREEARLEAVVAHIFADLRRVNRAKGSRLVLVFLPGAWDYTGDDRTEAWRGFVAREAARQGILFLDLVEEIRRLPPTGVDEMYAPNMHFSEKGNEWAARTLNRLLQPVVDAAAAEPDTARTGGG